MRFHQLILSRFGAHTDLQLRLREDAAVHLLVGPNASGKSTLREAIGDYLFGIHLHTRWAFQHNPQDLRIEGHFGLGGQRHEAARIKRAKNTVVDPMFGLPCDPDPIALAVGTTSRALYERMYSLDRDRLTAGGREMLENKDDTSRLLFQAASGLTDLTATLRALEEEADSLYAIRKSDKRVYWTAQGAYDAAKGAARSATLRKPEWRRRNELAQEALQQLENLRVESDKVDQELTALRRLRACAPHLRRRGEHRRAREAMGEVLLLPADAAQIYTTTSEALRDAAQDEVQFRAQVEQTDAALARIIFDPTILNARALIELAARLGQQTVNHEADLGGQGARAAAALRQATDIGRRLGWGEVLDPEVLRQKVPSKIALAELQKLSTQHGTLRAALIHARQSHETAKDLAGRRRHEADELIATEVDAGLKMALEEGRALGDCEATSRQHREAVLRAERSLQALLQLLAPWCGIREQLATLSPPTAEVAEGLLIEQTRLRTRREGTQARLDAVRDELRQSQQALADLGAGAAMATTEDVAGARQRRDEAWTAVAGDARKPADLADYQGLVAVADEIADKRYAGSEHAHRYDALSLTRREQEERIARLLAELDEQQGALEQLEQHWDATLAAVGLAGLPLAGYPKWRQQFEKALELDADLRVRQQLEQEHIEQVSKAAEVLRGGLIGAGQPPALMQAAGLGVLVGLAAEMADQAAKGQGALQIARKAATEALAAIEKAAQAERDAEQALEAWDRAWKAAAEAAGLPATISVEAAAAIEGEFPLLEQALQTHREASGRVNGMQRDLTAFAEAVERAATAAGTAVAEAPAITLQDLQARLAAADKAAAERERLEEQLRQRNESLKGAGDRRRRAETRLQPLLVAAGGGTLEELQLAIERSDFARRLDAQISEANGNALAAAEGVELESLAAQLESQDLDLLSARIQDLERRRQELDAQREQASAHHRDAEREREKMDGGSQAAAAEADRQMALSDMVAAAERYVEVKATLTLLRHGINRYREMNKDPLLQRASSIFERVTLGEYRRLEVDGNDRKPQLIAEKAGGRTLTLDAMSEGTAQQLYFALRLAALESHLDGGGAALPFVADDIFMASDDERAAEGFKVLAELSRKTQVFYLSHHMHLVPVAKEALGDGLDVNAIGRWVDSAALALV